MRFYTKTHEWFDTDTNQIGITNFAAKELGDIVYINMPDVGDTLIEGEQFADVESVKAVAEINSPVSGIVAEINMDVEENPEMINDNADENWIIIATQVDIGELLTKEEYLKYIENEVN